MLDAGLGFGEEDRRFFQPRDWKIRRWQTDAYAKFKEVFLRRQGFFTFTVYAGVGSGKTGFAALIAADLLRNSLIDRVVFVCNNRTIKVGARLEFARFGIHLTDWNNGKHSFRGEDPTSQGAVVTYQALAKNPHPHAAACKKNRTLVIFDEIHHLGEDKTWADAATVAFDGLAYAVVGLSGTPYRTDDLQIPFATYLKSESGLYYLKADAVYTLGQAIVDLVCRRPMFRFAAPSVVFKHKGEAITKAFTDKDITEEMAQAILSESCRPSDPKKPSDARKMLTKEAIDFCRSNEGRPKKLIVFVDRQEDADTILPMELAHLGITPDEIVSVTHDDRDAVAKIRGFGKSDAWILITVDMVSEGTNIPELEVALFLSNVTARTKTVQRIGRIVRGVGHAWVFMFKHPFFVQYSLDIEKERQDAIRLNSSRPQPSPSSGPEGRGFTPPPPKALATSAYMDGIAGGGHISEESIYEQAMKIVRSENLDPSRDLPGIVALIRRGVIKPGQADGEVA